LPSSVVFRARKSYGSVLCNVQLAGTNPDSGCRLTHLRRVTFYGRDQNEMFTMHGNLNALAAVVMATAVAMSTSAFAQPADHIKVGTLTCDIAAGIGAIIVSKRNIACMFTPAKPGPRAAGTITKFGLDLGGAFGGEMIWAVYAPTNRVFGARTGRFVGATAEATVGVGVGANVLVGGSNRTVTLQPVSVQGQTGLINIAAGVAGL
jgi:hypothetical protein